LVLDFYVALLKINNYLLEILEMEKRF